MSFIPISLVGTQNLTLELYPPETGVAFNEVLKPHKDTGDCSMGSTMNNQPFLFIRFTTVALVTDEGKLI